MKYHLFLKRASSSLQLIKKSAKEDQVEKILFSKSLVWNSPLVVYNKIVALFTLSVETSALTVIKPDSHFFTGLTMFLLLYGAT